MPAAERLLGASRLVPGDADVVAGGVDGAQALEHVRIESSGNASPRAPPARACAARRADVEVRAEDPEHLAMSARRRR